MKYEIARPLIKSGDVLIWTHKGWGSWYDIQVQIVRMATRSEYCHVGIAWVVGGRVFVIEAVSPQVRIYPLSKEVPFYWIPCGEKYWDEFVEEFALSKVGDKYSKVDAILTIFDALFPGANNQWHCAEFVNIVLNKGGLLYNPKAITPSLLVEELQRLDFRIGIVNG